MEFDFVMSCSVCRLRPSAYFPITFPYIVSAAHYIIILLCIQNRLPMSRRANCFNRYVRVQSDHYYYIITRPSSDGGSGNVCAGEVQPERWKWSQGNRRADGQGLSTRGGRDPTIFERHFFQKLGRLYSRWIGLLIKYKSINTSITNLEAENSLFYRQPYIM